MRRWVDEVTARDLPTFFRIDRSIKLIYHRWILSWESRLDIQSTRSTCTSRDTEKKREQRQSRPGERSRLSTNPGVESDGLKERKEGFAPQWGKQKVNVNVNVKGILIRSILYLFQHASNQATKQRLNEPRCVFDSTSMAEATTRGN
jgi:hypothetical protein